jgi:dynein heavy chain
MHSHALAQVPFDKPMMPTGNVEAWLGEVERRMKASIRTQVGLEMRQQLSFCGTKHTC